ncbi:hypothetical protein B0H13DRAFT_2328936 [Mycena leptocephala]|nr:hypothetical protein B0H13DRAFT_2328936 [Mycena leptocephala]
MARVRGFRQDSTRARRVGAGSTQVCCPCVAHDNPGELRRALAHKRGEGKTRAKHADRLLREAKDDLEERDVKVRTLRAELGRLHHHRLRRLPASLGEPAATDGPSLTIAHALDAADHLRFRDLQGDVYYLQLQRLDMSIDIPGAQAAPPLPAQLSDLNKLRLLTGYHSLILSWILSLSWGHAGWALRTIKSTAFLNGTACGALRCMQYLPVPLCAVTWSRTWRRFRVAEPRLAPSL